MNVVTQNLPLVIDAVIHADQLFGHVDRVGQRGDRVGRGRIGLMRKQGAIQVGNTIAVKQAGRNDLEAAGVGLERFARSQTCSGQLVLEDCIRHLGSGRSIQHLAFRVQGLVILQVLAGGRAVRIRNRRVDVRLATLNDTAPFLVVEEEGLALRLVVNVRNEQRSAQVAAEDVLTELRNRGNRTIVLVEEVVGIKGVITSELVRFAVVLLRAALEREAHRGAGGDTVIRRIVGGQNFELRDRVLRRHDVHAAGAAAVIRFATVDQPDVVAFTKAVDADRKARRDRGRGVAVRQVRADAQAE